MSLENDFTVLKNVCALAMISSLLFACSTQDLGSAGAVKASTQKGDSRNDGDLSVADQGEIEIGQTLQIKSQAQGEKKDEHGGDQKTPVEEAKTPVEEEKTPVEEEKTPVEEEKTPVEEEKTPVEEEKTPVEEEETPVEEEETPVEEEETPVEEEETPMTDPFPSGYLLEHGKLKGLSEVHEFRDRCTEVHAEKCETLVAFYDKVAIKTYECRCK